MPATALEHPTNRFVCTVVTERRGPLAGRRVVRGREAECRDAARSEGG